MRVFLKALFLSLILAVLCVPLAAQSNQPMYIYVSNGAGNGSLGIFSVFKVDTVTGALSVVPGSPFQAGGSVQSIAVDPAGRYVYVSSAISGPGNTLYVFSVDLATGSLTPILGSPFPGAGGAISLDPTGRFLFANSGTINHELSVHAIDPVSGVPTPIAGSPFPAQGASPMTIDPGGNYVYYLNNGFWINASIDFESGTPTPITGAQIPWPGGSSTNWIAMDPLDRFVATNGISIAPINSVNGALINFPPPVPSSGSSVYDPSGRFLYAFVGSCPNPGVQPCGPAVFLVDPVSGALTPLAGSNFGSSIFSNPIVDPTDRFVYALSFNPGGLGSGISGFSINQTTGALTPLAGPPLLMTYSDIFNIPMAISVAPTGISNPVPSISSFSPSSIIAGGAGFTLTVNGTNFVLGARVYFGGRGRTTTFVNSTQLTATIFRSDIANGGSGLVFVYNPLPVGGPSQSSPFLVLNPLPTLTSISTTSVIAGSDNFVLTLIGTNLQPTSVVTLNGTPFHTFQVNPIELQISVPNDEIAIPGTIAVGITTPPINGQGGGNSNTLPLTVTPVNLPPPVISQIAPGSATAGGPSFPMLITGVGFAANSLVTFGGVPVTVTNFSATTGTTLTVTIPASTIVTTGTVSVVVSTAAGISPGVNFLITNPPPTTGGVTPPVVPAGSAALTLNVAGTNFVSGSTVLVNGAPRATTFVSSTLLQATLLASDISHGGTLAITVSSPGPGGGLSAAVTLAIADYSVNPVSASASVSSGQTAHYTLTVAPSNGAFANPVTFSVSGLPAGASATFSSSTVTPGATPTDVTLSISTTARSSLLFRRAPQWPLHGMQLLILAGLALAMCGLHWNAPKIRARALAPQFLLGMLLVMAAGLVSCGGSTQTGGSGGGISGGTPAGTYSVVVTATSGGDVHTTTVTLTVM